MASRDSAGGQTVQGVFARHDYQPKLTICEQNVWGLAAGGMGSFLRRYWQSQGGISFAHKTTDVVYRIENGKRIREVRFSDPIYTNTRPCAGLFAQSSKDLTHMGLIHVPIAFKLDLGGDNHLYAHYTGKRIPLWRLFGANPTIRTINGQAVFEFGENLS